MDCTSSLQKRYLYVISRVMQSIRQCVSLDDASTDFDRILSKVIPMVNETVKV